MPISIFSSRTGRMAWVLAALVTAGCAAPGPEHPPLATTTAAMLGLGAADTKVVPTQWWQGLGDAQLNQLMAQALQGHPSLAAARARLARAQALADVSRSTDGPHASLGADATRQHYSAHGLVPAPIAGNTWNSANLQATVGWSPDFFDRNATELAAALGQARAARADAAAATQVLAAQVGRSYIALARWLAQQAVAEQTLVQRQALWDLTRQRVAAGLDSQVDATQAQAALTEAQSQQEVLQEQITLARRQIAVLCAQAPDAQSALTPRLEHLTLEPVPDTLGADLLGRRADVVAARWRVEAATQGVALARTDFYPDIHLGAFIGLNALGLNHLLSTGARQMGVTPALRLPLFDGERLRAQLGSRQAELDAAIAQYNGAVLESVKQAGDAIASAQSLARQHSLQAQASAQAQTSYRLAAQRHQAGLSNTLALLHSESQVLAQRRLAVDVRARQLDTQIVLMQALGGGWHDDTAPLTTATR